MNLYLIETKSQCIHLDKFKVNQSIIIALTTEAMYWLDKMGYNYNIPNDYLPLEFFINVRQKTREKNINFCKKLDKRINLKFGNENSILKNGPAFWASKFSYLIIQTVISYNELIDKIINIESPDKVVYFKPIRISKMKSIYGNLLFNNDSFLSNFINFKKIDYSDINWQPIIIKQNDSLINSRLNKNIKQKLRNSIPYPILKKLIALKNKKWPGKVNKNNTFNVLNLGASQDIYSLCTKLADLKLANILNKEDLALNIDQSVNQWSQEIFYRRHKKILREINLEHMLFSKNDFSIALYDAYGKISDSIVSFILEKYNVYHHIILNSYLVYKAAKDVLRKKKISCVIGHSGVDPINNAIFYAARRNRIKTYIFQHGGEYGESFDYGEVKNTCYEFADYFGLWGKKNKDIIEKNTKTRCSFFYLGHLKQTNSQNNTNKKQINKINKILFVHNNAFHGYLPLMKDCMWFRFHKKIIEIFQRFPEYDYIYRPTPKVNTRFNALTEYFKDKIPEHEILDTGTLSNACTKADLIIIDCLSTTLHDALSVNSKLIGLKHPAYNQYFPEIENIISKACILCKTENDFLNKIENLLMKPETFPDVKNGIHEFNSFYSDESTVDQYSERFLKHFNKSDS